jgi:hypothetical protein
MNDNPFPSPISFDWQSGHRASVPTRAGLKSQDNSEGSVQGLLAMTSALSQQQQPHGLYGNHQQRHGNSPHSERAKGI